MRKSTLDTNGQIFANIRAAVEATYVVSMRIAKWKKPHIIGRELVLPYTKDIVRLMFGADTLGWVVNTADVDNQF